MERILRSPQGIAARDLWRTRWQTLKIPSFLSPSTFTCRALCCLLAVTPPFSLRIWCEAWLSARSPHFPSWFPLGPHPFCFVIEGSRAKRANEKTRLPSFQLEQRGAHVWPWSSLVRAGLWAQC